jgi:hypothetical protein
LVILTGWKKDESDENCIMTRIITYTVQIRNKIKNSEIGWACSIEGNEECF